MAVRLSASRLRRRLAWLMLLSLAPACSLILFVSAQQRAETIEQSRDAMRRYVSIAVLDLERKVGAVHDLLTMLSLSPAIEQQDRFGCERLLGRISRRNPELNNIGLVRLDGSVICSALPEYDSTTDLSDRDYFRMALERRSIAASRFFVGRITGQGSVAFAMPVNGKEGEPVAVVYVATRFYGIERVARNLAIDRDRGDLLLVLDREGTIVDRYPDDGNWAGRRFAGHPMVETILTAGNGEEAFVSLDGVPRRFAFRSIQVGGEPAYHVAIGIDERDLAAGATRTFVFGVLAVALVALAGFAILWFGAGRVFGRRLDEVVSAAGALAQGDVDVRIAGRGGGGRSDELDLIAGAFNSMADALAQRESDWRQATRALESASALNASILDSLSARLVVLDAKGRVLASNAAWNEDVAVPNVGEDYLASLGRDEASLAETCVEAMRQAINGVLSHPDRLCFADEARCGQVCAGVEYSRGEGGAQRWFEMRVTPLRGSEGGAVIAHEDITERKQLGLRLEELVSELARSNSELQDFAYVASHDLQEPLRKVVAFADRFESSYAERLDERGLDYLGRMTDAARRMQQLINDLLTMSRVHTRAQPMRRVELDRVVAEVLSDLEERVHESQARIHVDALPTVMADATQIRQVLQNLIGNALKFVPVGVAPDVEVALEAARPGWVRVCVRDRGIGLPDEGLDRIFAPFVRLHGRSEYAGTGLGLAVVRRIVERHGGRVEAYPREGGGACFCFELRLCDDGAL